MVYSAVSKSMVPSKWFLLGDKAGFALNYRGSNCGNNVILETFLLESIVNRLSYLEMVDMEIPPL